MQTRERQSCHQRNVHLCHQPDMCFSIANISMHKISHHGLKVCNDLDYVFSLHPQSIPKSIYQIYVQFFSCISNKHTNQIRIKILSINPWAYLNNTICYPIWNKHNCVFGWKCKALFAFFLAVYMSSVCSTQKWNNTKTECKDLKMPTFLSPCRW